MPKSIDLSNLPDTGGIKLDTGEMTAVAIEAIKKEARERERQSVTQQWIAVLDARDSIISYCFSRILEGAKPWKAKYDAEFDEKSPYS